MSYDIAHRHRSSPTMSSSSVHSFNSDFFFSFSVCSWIFLLLSFSFSFSLSPIAAIDEQMRKIGIGILDLIFDFCVFFFVLRFVSRRWLSDFSIVCSVFIAVACPYWSEVHIYGFRSWSTLSIINNSNTKINFVVDEFLLAAPVGLLMIILIIGLFFHCGQHQQQQSIEPCCPRHANKWPVDHWSVRSPAYTQDTTNKSRMLIDERELFYFFSIYNSPNVHCKCKCLCKL